MASNLIVGTKECSSQTVTKILSSSDSFPLFYDKWMDICIDLEISGVNIKSWKQSLLLDKNSLKYVLSEMIESWVGAKGSEASIEVLLTALASNELKVLAELLENELLCSKKKPKKYCRIPQGLQEFFESTSSFVTVSTPDSSITCEKIRENCNCLILNTEQFMEEISVKNGSPGQMVVVANREEMEEVLEHSEFCQKLAIIIEEPEENLKFESNKIIKDEMLWEDLTPKFKLEIKRRVEELIGLKIQKISGQILVDLINKNELKLFQKSIPEELLISYYVPRILKRGRLDKEKLFKSNRDIFVFSGITKLELSKLVRTEMTENSSNLLHKRVIQNRFIILDDSRHFLKICEKTEQAVHWIEFNGEFNWVKSNKHIEIIQKLIKKGSCEESLTEDEFVKFFMNNDARVVCVSDSPGMGKSILLANIGKKLKESNRIVLFAAISDAIALMKEIISTESFQEALAQISCKNEVEKEILRRKIISPELEIELLLDGFDEVGRERLPFTFQFLQFLTQLNSIRIWVSTRPHHREELERKLNTISFNIQPFTEKDQIEFLTSFWSRNQDFELDKLRSFSRNCLEVLSPFKHGQVDIAGIPLQCHLLAEVFEENAVNCCSFGNSGEFYLEPREIDSIAILYERLIEKKYKKYDQTYSGPSKLDKTLLNEMHSRLSLELIFPNCFHQLNLFSRPVHIDELLNVGLLERSSSTPKFIHRTFAEYFCAYFIFEKLFKSSYLPQNTLIDFFCNKFLDCLVTDNIWASDETFFEDAGYVFIHFVPCYFLNCFISHTKNQLPSSTDISFQRIRALCLACARDNFQALFGLFQDHPCFEEYCEDVFDQSFLLTSIESFDLEFLKTIYSHFETSSRLSSTLKRECLRKAIKSNDVSKLEYLLKVKGLLYNYLGENVIANLVESCVQSTAPRLHLPGLNNTELAGRIQILRFLVSCDETALEQAFKSFFFPVTALIFPYVAFSIRLELIKLGANVLAQDKDGNSVLHSFAKSNSEFLQYFKVIPKGMLRDLMQMRNSKGLTPLATAFKNKIQFSRESLEKWKEAGADFNEVAEDPLFLLAIESGNGKEGLRFLLENGADLAWNKYNKSFLDFAAETGNPEAVNFLVKDHGMDVNGLENLKSPLDYLLFKWTSEKIDCEGFYETGEELWSLGGMCKSFRVYTLTEYAIENKDLSALKFSFKIGSNVNEIGEDGNILHLVCKRWNNLEAVKICLEAGVCLNTKNIEGLNPFELTLMSGESKIELVRILNPNKDYESVSSLVSSQHFSKLIFNSADDLTDSEFISLFEEGLERDEKCFLLSLLKKESQLSPAQFHLIVKNLILKGDLEKLSFENNGKTALHKAVKVVKGIEEKTLRMLYLQEVDFNKIDKMGRSLVFYAVKGEQTTEFLGMLCKYGANLFQKDASGQTLLNIAVRTSEDPKTVKFLLENGLDPNWQDLEGNTLLHFVIEWNEMKERMPNLEQATALVNGGAKPEIKNKEGFTPFDLALRLPHFSIPGKKKHLYWDVHSCFDFFKVFREGNPNGELISSLDSGYLGNFLFPLNHQLKEEDFLYVAKTYLKILEGENKNELLMQSFLQGNFFASLHSSRFHLLAENLLEEGRNVFTERDGKGAQALHYAVEGIKMEERTLQLFKSIDLGGEDNDGWTLLFYAVRGRTASPGFLTLLSKYTGRSLKEKDRTGLGLLHVAVMFNNGKNLNVVKFLLEAGLDPNEVDEDGDTALHALLKQKEMGSGLGEKAKVLVEAGAKINVKNLEGDTALDLAEKLRFWAGFKERLLEMSSVVGN